MLRTFDVHETGFLQSIPFRLDHAPQAHEPIEGYRESVRVQPLYRAARRVLCALRHAIV